MIGGTLGFLLFAILIPLLVNEAGDLVPPLARCLLRWGARRIGDAGQAARYEEEWIADLERIPGKLTKLVHVCGVLVRSVPRLRAQFRRRPHRGRLSGRMTRRIGRQLAGSEEMAGALHHVAEALVPEFADHCFIDLLQGDVLIRRLQRHAGGWTPPPGTWAEVGEQIRYPEGHFCVLAMRRLDTVLVADLIGERIPAPSARSAAATYQVGLTSVLSAPLYARGVLFGVMSVARSRLTDRPEPRFTAADRDLIGAAASRAAAAIGNAQRLQPGRQSAVNMQNPPLQRRPHAFLAPG